MPPGDDNRTVAEIREWVATTVGVFGPDAPEEGCPSYDPARSWWRDCALLLYALDAAIGMHVETVDQSARLLIVTTGDQELDPESAADLGNAIRQRVPGLNVAFVTGGFSVEALDENAMAAAGWVPIDLLRAAHRAALMDGWTVDEVADVRRIREVLAAGVTEEVAGG